MSMSKYFIPSQKPRQISFNHYLQLGSKSEQKTTRRRRSYDDDDDLFIYDEVFIMIR